MAMTACAAKFCNKCPEDGAVLAQRYPHHSPSLRQFHQRPASGGALGALSNIDNLHEGFAVKQAIERPTTKGSHWSRQELLERRRHVSARQHVKMPVIASLHGSERRVAEPQRLVEHRLEHRRQIAGRRIYDLQHPGGRGLLLQCFAGFGQEPRVLDGNHRLIGEGAHEFDLSFGEGLDASARQPDHADDLALTEHRHAEERANFADIYGARVVIFGVRSDIGDVYDFALKRHAPCNRSPTALERAPPQLHDILG
jgi:hypothetical protein